MNNTVNDLSRKDMNNWRVIVVGVIQNKNDEYLICRKPMNRGVFPGQWALPGGGIEPGEHMEDALRREIKEETGIDVFDIKPLSFKDGQYPKLFPDGSSRDIYMIFLLFTCRACSEEVIISEEFEAFTWVRGEDLADFDLNEETSGTFTQMGLLSRSPSGDI